MTSCFNLFISEKVDLTDALTKLSTLGAHIGTGNPYPISIAEKMSIGKPSIGGISNRLIIFLKT